MSADTSCSFLEICIFGIALFILSGAEMQTVPPGDTSGGSGDVALADALHPTEESTSHRTPLCTSAASGDVAASDSVACSDVSPPTAPLLALPAPSDHQAEGDSAMQLTLGQRVSLEEELGPLVVNTDGTVGRISNWKQMTEGERASVLRVLGKRNKERLETLKEQSLKPNE
jgi:hypothetical protein